MMILNTEKLAINVSHLIQDSLIDFIMSNGSGEIWNYKNPPKTYNMHVIVSSSLNELVEPFLDYFKLKSAWIKRTCQLPGEMYLIHKDIGYANIRRYIFLQRVAYFLLVLDNSPTRLLFLHLRISNAFRPALRLSSASRSSFFNLS